MVGVPGVTVEINAGADLIGFTCVRLYNAQIFTASSDQSAHAHELLGIIGADTAFADPADVTTYGVLRNASWNWDLTLPIYCGVNGVLTQTPPSGWQRQVAMPRTATSIFVSISEHGTPGATGAAGATGPAAAYGIKYTLASSGPAPGNAWVSSGTILLNAVDAIGNDCTSVLNQVANGMYAAIYDASDPTNFICGVISNAVFAGGAYEFTLNSQAGTMNGTGIGHTAYFQWLPFVGNANNPFNYTPGDPTQWVSQYGVPGQISTALDRLAVAINTISSGSVQP